MQFAPTVDLAIDTLWVNDVCEDGLYCTLIDRCSLGTCRGVRRPGLAWAGHAGVVVALARTTRLRVTLSVPVLDTDPFGRLAWLSLGFVTVEPP